MAMLTWSNSRQSSIGKSHAERGAFRSAMGTSDQAYERMQVFEESERMEALEETKEIVTDIALAERQFKYFNKKL